MELRFKLASSLLNSPTVPVAAPTMPAPNSHSLKVLPGQLDELRTLSQEELEYTADSVDSVDSDYYRVTLSSVMPPQTEAYSDQIKEDLLVGPVGENMVWVIQNRSGDAVKANNHYLSLLDLNTNQSIPHRLQYSSDSDTWSYTDDTLDYVRFVFAAQDIIGAVLLATFATITSTGDPVHHYRLITPVPRFTDFSLTEIVGRSAGYGVLKFHRANYEAEFGITGSLPHTIAVQNNPLSNIEVKIPRRRRSQPWTFQIRKATEILGKTFVSTANLLGSRPAVVTQEVPARITPGVLKLSQKDLKVYSGGTIADLHDDWATGIHLTVNGQDKTSQILDVNETEGYVLLKQPVARTSSVLVDYAVDTTKWVEVFFDLNPGVERNRLRPAWLNFDVDTSAYGLYVQKNTMGPDLLIGPTARLNKLYPYPATLNDPTQASEFITRRPNHIALATLSVENTRKVSIVDIRRPGGGLKPRDQTNDDYDLKSHTGLGFYDGRPIQENVLVIQLPLEVYDSVYNRYTTNDTNPLARQQDTFLAGSTLKLSETPHFNYTKFDWLHAAWDTPQITVDVTDSDGDTQRAIDLTDYRNLTNIPTVLRDYDEVNQYLFYYFRKRVYLNAAAYTSVRVTYNYVSGTPAVDQDAHVAASKYIHDGVQMWIANGTYYVLHDTDGNPYPATRGTIQQT